jgi:hypothetical protein
MFETVNNPLIIAGGVLAGLLVLVIICKIIVMTWRIVHIKPNQNNNNKLKQMGIFNNRQ